MTIHRVTLKSPDAQGRREIFGYLSKILPLEEAFLLMEKDQIGMMGRDGLFISMADCESVYCETKPGMFTSEEQLTMWRRTIKGLGHR